VSAPLQLATGTLPNGRTVKFGRLPEVASGPHFRFKRYKLVGMPDEPATCDYTQGASISAALADIYGNDSLGDCVIAALYHLLALWTGNATGTAFHATLQQIIAMYSAVGGYVPGDPSTDGGCDMTVAMNYICANGYANGDKPLGWIRIDGTNAKELRQAIWLFEGCDFAIGLPDAYVAGMQSMSNGFTWGVNGAANQNNGHSFMGAGYDSTGVTIDTWGMLGKFTFEAIAAYATQTNGGEIDILLSADMIAKAVAKAPNGFDWQALIADFNEMGGNVPAPSPPTPPTPPTPAPGSPVTLAMAKAWAQAGIRAGAALQDQDQACANSDAGLDKSWPAAS